MAFKRIVEMKAGTTQTSVVISGLDISFEINRTRKFSNNIAKFKIYGALDDTISRVLKKGNSITFSAGYEDEGIGLIYIGQITQSIPSKNPPEKIVSLECVSGKSVDSQSNTTDLSLVTFSLSYKKGTNISRPLKEIAKVLGLSICGLENVTNINMANGFLLAGTAKEAMGYAQSILERNGLIMFIDNTTLKISKKGSGGNTAAVKLTANTGLLEAPRLTDNTEGDEKVQEQLTKRALFRSILNYRIIPDGHVDIDHSGVKGVFIVDKCKYKGDNFGGAFEVSGEAIGGEARTTTSRRRVSGGTTQLTEF